jgi:hypothetical protein
MDKHQPSLPSQRAFVVQLHAEARPDHGQWDGRVEHIDSYQAVRFQSLEELVAFMVRCINATPEPEEAALPLADET